MRPIKGSRYRENCPAFEKERQALLPIDYVEAGSPELVQLAMSYRLGASGQKGKLMISQSHGIRIFLQSPSTIFMIAVLALPVFAQKKQQDLSRIQSRLAEEVRHELVMLPYYSVFDNLEYRVQDTDTVELSGQVTRPTLKSDAENVVKRIEGVGKVINNIEVLPVSPHDDDIRRAAYRTIFSKPGLDRYSLQAVPPIHIIVKNGHITLVGIVATEADRNLAEISAKGVSGAFSVTNKLRVEKS
jgi:hyperosmotically inducible protein